MELKVQKRLAAKLLKCSPKKIKIDVSRLEDIKESITKHDIRGLIKDGGLVKRKTQESSRARAKKIKIQKKKGKRKGTGSRKGTSNARLSEKKVWMNTVRAQRRLLKELRDEEKISLKAYRQLYMKSKGGFFRSRRHINLFIEEHNLLKGKK